MNGKRTRARNGYLVGPQETCFIFNIMGRCLIYSRGTNSIIGPNISLFTSNTTHNRADRGKLSDKTTSMVAKSEKNLFCTSCVYYFPHNIVMSNSVSPDSLSSNVFHPIEIKIPLIATQRRHLPREGKKSHVCGKKG